MISVPAVEEGENAAGVNGVLVETYGTHPLLAVEAGRNVAGSL